MDGEYDPRFLDGIDSFNKRCFFQAHEVWEDVWRDCHGPAKRFYQGLIQIAVCLHHFRNGNTRGARSLYRRSRGHLEQYRPEYLGVALDTLLEDLAVCCRDLANSDEETPAVRIDESSIPTISHPSFS